MILEISNHPEPRLPRYSARAKRAAIVEVMTNLAIADPRAMFRITDKDHSFYCW